MAIKHGVELKISHMCRFIQPRFIQKRRNSAVFISESVRGEGAKLYDKHGKRFVNELLPRDLLTAEIHKQMEKDGTDYVWEDLRKFLRKS